MKLSKEIQDLLVEIKRRDLSIAKFAKQIGVPADRVYQWQNGRGNPKSEDSKKIQDWMVNVPRDTVSAGNASLTKTKSQDALISVIVAELAALRAERNELPFRVR